ncbi:type II toxin-antitoxin system RelE/ParE family toxin [Ligilactobacillus salivarius]|uniref:type II toxin-antitoxin system RelE/ParE family toxin n=1 Tax=Ligilactobacillus salivarius TaxID=1624 RepID=UPI0036475459
MKVARTRVFDRNFKKLARKNYPVGLVRKCVDAILDRDSETLVKMHDHSLKGKWKGYRAFHPARLEKGRKEYDNWVVVYQIRKKELILVLVDTGDHGTYK